MEYLEFRVYFGTVEPGWAQAFRKADVTERALMLAFAMEQYSDGKAGLSLSFSEPVIKSDDGAHDEPTVFIEL